MKKLPLINLVLIIIVGAITIYLAFGGTSKKQAWLDLNKLYNEFEMKKELDKKFLATENARKKITDSLELDLKLVFTQLQKDEKNKELINVFETKREYFLTRKQQLDEDSQQNRDQLYEQILNQINQYIKDLGKSENYSIIFGADGRGTVMYADDKIDITNHAIEFINKKYRGQ